MQVSLSDQILDFPTYFLTIISGISPYVHLSFLLATTRSVAAATLAVVVSFVRVASDDGQTQPRLNYATNNSSGTAQSVTIDSAYMPYPDTTDTLTRYSDWVPFNVRFATSIRVQLKKSAAASGTEVWCATSRALD